MIQDKIKTWIHDVHAHYISSVYFEQKKLQTAALINYKFTDNSLFLSILYVYPPVCLSVCHPHEGLAFVSP